MFRTLTSRIAVTSVLTLAGFVGVSAQAQAPSPQVIFTAGKITVASGSGDITVSKGTTPVLPVKVTATDPSGVTGITLLSKAGVGSARFPAGATTGSITITFYDSYYPNGDYKFTANVTNAKGVTTAQSLMVHVGN